MSMGAKGWFTAERIRFSLSVIAALGGIALLVVTLLGIQTHFWSEQELFIELDRLEASSNYDAWFRTAQGNSSRFGVQGAARLAAKAWSIHSRINMTESIQKLLVQLENSLSQSESGFLLLAHMRLALEQHGALQNQYKTAGRAPDWIYAQSIEQTRKSPEADVAMIMQVSGFKGLSLGNFFRHLAEVLDAPGFMYFSAGFLAMQGSMSEASREWNRALVTKNFTSRQIQGAFDLAASSLQPADALVIQSAVDSLSQEPDVRIRSALAEALYRQGSFLASYDAWIALAKSLPVHQEWEWVFENIVSLSSNRHINDIHETSRQVGMGLVRDFYQAFPFPVQSAQKSWERLKAEFWFVVLDYHDRPQVWRTLAWLLASARDKESLYELLRILSFDRDPWIAFYEGVLYGLQGKWNDALAKFVQSGNEGIPEGALNASLLYAALGDTALSVQYRKKAHLLLKLFFPKDWISMNTGEAQ